MALKPFMVMENTRIALPNVEHLAYNDKDGLLLPYNFDSIDSIQIVSGKDNTNNSGFIMFIPLEYAHIMNFDTSQAFVWSFDTSLEKVTINAAYNQFYNNKLINTTYFGIMKTGFPKNHSDFTIRIVSNSKAYNLKITSEVPLNKMCFPILGGYIFKDPFYTKPILKTYTSDLVEINNAQIPSISGAILRDQSVANEKIKSSAITSRTIASGNIFPQHFNTPAFVDFSVMNFKTDYDASRLVYLLPNSHLTRFTATEKVIWSVGGTGGVTREVSLNSSSTTDFKPKYLGTTNLTSEIIIDNRPYKYTEAYYSSSDGITTDVALRSPKLESHICETESLIITNNHKIRPSERVNNKTSAAMMLKRDGTKVQLELKGFVDGDTPAEAAFVTGILGGRSGNDYADLLPCTIKDVLPEHGKCYSIDERGVLRYPDGDADPFFVGVCSDAYGVYSGDKDISHFPWAVAGSLNVHIRNPYSEPLSPGQPVGYMPGSGILTTLNLPNGNNDDVNIVGKILRCINRFESTYQILICYRYALRGWSNRW